MYLRLIRPHKLKAESGYKGEFIPETPTIKVPETKTANDVALAFGVPPDVLEQVDPLGEQFAVAKENIKSNPRKRPKASRNPTKNELVELLGGSDGQD